MARFLDVLALTVERYGNLPAVEDDAGAITYRELWEESGRVASELQRRLDADTKEHAANGGTGFSCYILGATQRLDLPVIAARFETKTRDAIIALIGIWRAGAAYLPVDPSIVARSLFVLKDAGAQLVVDEYFFASLRKADAAASTPSAQAEEREDDIAYLIYTSGSTGTPKGVIVSHRGLVPVLRAQIRELGLGPGKRSLFVLSTAFDASLSDIGTALLSGATLVIPPQLEGAPTPIAATPTKLLETLRDRRITHVDLPPSVLPKIDPSLLPPNLEHVIVGGEVADRESLCAWARRVKMTIAYGPTEATICTSMVRVDPETWSRPLIGTPIEGIRYRVAEDGELLIASDHGALAIGYLNRPELTKERFVTGGDGGGDRERWFRTRDRVREISRGGTSLEYEFLGRADRQLKIRGVLVAPEEIEAVISAQSSLHEHNKLGRVAVVHRPLREVSQEKKAPLGLVAFLEVDDPARGGVIDYVKASVRSSLMRAMWPQRYELIDRMPETSSGKIDYAALSRAELSPNTRMPTRDVPRNASEMILVAAAEEVLGIPDITRDDDFFALGGDSFTVLELAAATLARGLFVPPSAVYQQSIFGPLAHSLDGGEISISASQLRKIAAEGVAKLPTQEHQTSTTFGRPTQVSAAAERVILMTGATGFLGSHVLPHVEDLQNVARVHCIVRDPEAFAGAHARSHHSKTNVIKGDVALPRLGLTEELWSELAKEVTDVIHFAAQVDMVRPFDALRATNLDGTLEILRFLRLFAPKRLHYASTLSVFVSTNKCTGLLREDDVLDDTGAVYGGYGQTKWAAEVAVRAALNKNANANENESASTIHRFGLLTAPMWREQPLAPPKNCQLTMFLRGLLEIGLLPATEYTNDLALDVTPVDYAARAFVHLMNTRESSATATTAATFHIANRTSLSLKTILDELDARGVKLVTTSPHKFIARAAAAPITKAKAVVLASLVRRVEGRGRFGQSTDLFLATKADFDTSRTIARLEAFKIKCPDANAILSAHLDHVLQAQREPPSHE